MTKIEYSSTQSASGSSIMPRSGRGDFINLLFLILITKIMHKMAGVVRFLNRSQKINNHRSNKQHPGYNSLCIVLCLARDKSCIARHSFYTGPGVDNIHIYNNQHTLKLPRRQAEDS
jgi:hypothetical protein